MHAFRRILIISAVAVVAVVAAGCSSGSDKTTTASGGSSTTAAPASAGDAYGGGAAAGESSSSSSADVSVADNAKFGKLLVGPSGKTLYLFEKDNGTTTACTGGCVPNWPALTASGTPTAGQGVDASKLSTANGEKPNQVVYNGHLLYYFAGDAAPGDVNGVNIPAWYPVNPAGDKIETD